MKSIDIKSVIIGVLGTILVFVSIGATDKNLGDITVNSITVMDDGSGGFLRTHNADGKMTAYLGTGEDGIGFLRTSNKHEVMTGYFGTNTDNDGVAMLYDRYGDTGWGESGKK